MSEKAVAFIKGNDAIETAIQAIKDVQKEIHDYIEFQKARVIAGGNQLKEREEKQWQALADVLSSQGAIKEGEFDYARDTIGFMESHNIVWVDAGGKVRPSSSDGIPPELKRLLSSLFQS